LFHGIDVIILASPSRSRRNERPQLLEARPYNGTVLASVQEGRSERLRSSGRSECEGAAQRAQQQSDKRQKSARCVHSIRAVYAITPLARPTTMKTLPLFLRCAWITKRRYLLLWVLWFFWVVLLLEQIVGKFCVESTAALRLSC
jgi:hypothetical protein